VVALVTNDVEALVVGEVFGGQYDGKQSGHFIIDLASLMLNQESRPRR
jgi:hypothetical protein